MQSNFKIYIYRDVLITKAISWLLRDLIKLNRQKVDQYLTDNSILLPAIELENLGLNYMLVKNLPEFQLHNHPIAEAPIKL